MVSACAPRRRHCVSRGRNGLRPLPGPLDSPYRDCDDPVDWLELVLQAGAKVLAGT
jgi:hypothetical protein